MSSFNELNGVPASGDKKIMMDLLRGKMNFNGFVVSDWNSVTEMIPHGYAKDEKHAAELGTNAGVDMEMTSQSYEKQVDRLIASEAYGEKMATDWMDLARYADTHGYQVDRYRDMSPWRDWVIASFIV